MRIKFIIIICLLLSFGEASTQSIGDAGWTLDSSRMDITYPDIERWAKAGVIGGIPSRDSLDLKISISPESNIQNVIDDVSTNGGGVILFNSGIYEIEKEIKMRENVVLRGVSKISTVLKIKIRSQVDKSAIVFEGVSNSGIEDMRFTYDVVEFKPEDDRNNPIEQHCKICDQNNPNEVNDLYVGFLLIDSNSNNNWVENCEFIDAGTDPIKVYGDNNTLRYNLIDGSYNKGGGGQGYYDVRGNDNLFYKETIRRIRHFSIHLNASYNVVYDCDFINTDINFHNKDLGHNLIERNYIFSQAWRSWKHFWTGSSRNGHKPPGKGNIIYNNFTDIRGVRGQFSGSKSVYNYDNGFGFPKQATDIPPKGKTFYPIKYVGTKNP